MPVLIINLLWIGLLTGGLYSFWQVSYKIVLFLAGGFAVLWIVGYFLGSQKNKAKKIFQIYKQLRIYRPQTKEQDILKETSRLYFQDLRWDKDRIDTLLKVIFDEKEQKVKDIKDLASSIFVFERPSDDFHSNFNFGSFMKESKKRGDAVEWAYKKVFGDQVKVTERPALSEDVLQRMRGAGLNPDEMSNEQLAALEGMENVKKGNWLSKTFSYGSMIFGLVAIINLFTLNLGSFIVSGIISLLFMYIAYRIQNRVSSKKFYEASILKWSQDQEQKKDENKS